MAMNGEVLQELCDCPGDDLYPYACTLWQRCGIGSTMNTSACPSAPIPAFTLTSSSFGGTFQQVTMSEGMKAWTDWSYTYVNVPSDLIGATLFRGPHDSGNREFTISSNVDAYVYVWCEPPPNGNCSGLGWTEVGPFSPHFAIEEEARKTIASNYSENLTYQPLDLYTTAISAGRSMTFGPFVGAGGVAVKLAPVYTLTVISWIGTFEQVPMSEGMTGWDDRDYTYVNVPSELIGAILFRGPREDFGNREFIVSSNINATVYVWSRSPPYGPDLSVLGWTEKDPGSFAFVYPGGEVGLDLYSEAISAGSSISFTVTVNVSGSIPFIGGVAIKAT